MYALAQRTRRPPARRAWGEVLFWLGLGSVVVAWSAAGVAIERAPEVIDTIRRVFIGELARAEEDLAAARAETAEIERRLWEARQREEELADRLARIREGQEDFENEAG